MTMTMTDESFAYLVAEEVKNKLSPSQREVLLQKENWDKWQRCLVALQSNLDQQLEDIAEEEDADVQRFQSLGMRRQQNDVRNHYKVRRKRIERFKFFVEQRLIEVTKMIETGSTMESNGWDKVEFLKRAIAKHRSMIQEFDMEPTPIDEALWAALLDEWQFDNIDTESL